MGQLQTYACFIIKILKKIHHTTFNCISTILLAEDIIHKDINKK